MTLASWAASDFLAIYMPFFLFIDILGAFDGEAFLPLRKAAKSAASIFLGLPPIAAIFFCFGVNDFAITS